MLLSEEYLRISTRAQGFFYTITIPCETNTKQWNSQLTRGPKTSNYIFVSELTRLTEATYECPKVMCLLQMGWSFNLRSKTDHQPRLDAWDKCSDLVHWEDPEGSGGEGGGRGDRDGEYM